jgi:predicted lipid-binding transport protein (Tim44 family)
MQTESEGLDLIIILALVAVFILFQLRRTLGKKTGFDPSNESHKDQGGAPYQSAKNRQTDGEDNVVQIRPDAEQPKSVVNLGLNTSSPFYDTIEKINQIDRSFTVRSFFDGAEYAYGMVLNAFWDKDRKSLRSMLSRQVFDQFDGAIKQVEQQKHHSDNKLMDIEKIDLVEVSLTGSLAEISVEFTSHMIMVTRDEEGKLVEGNEDKPIKVLDIWTFCRDVKSRDPNWTLVATRTA